MQLQIKSPNRKRLDDWTFPAIQAAFVLFGFITIPRPGKEDFYRRRHDRITAIFYDYEVLK